MNLAFLFFSLFGLFEAQNVFDCGKTKVAMETLLGVATLQGEQILLFLRIHTF